MGIRECGCAPRSALGLSAPLHDHPFPLEEVPLAVPSPPVAASPPGCRDHAVTRDHQREAVGRHGAGHRPGASRPPELRRQFPVGPRLPARNAPQGLPYLPLKARSPKLHGKGETHRRILHNPVQRHPHRPHPSRPRILTLRPANPHEPVLPLHHPPPPPTPFPHPTPRPHHHPHPILHRLHPLTPITPHQPHKPQLPSPRSTPVKQPDTKLPPCNFWGSIVPWFP